MTNQQQTQAPRRVRPRPRMVSVSSVDRPAPNCVRVTFTGPELEGFATHGPAEHIKVLFARPGEARVQLPEWGAEGPVLGEGQSMPPSRTYTPRFWRPASLELVVDFILHGDGLASTWAASARPGDVLAVSGQPGGAYALDPAATSYVIGGDESALPGIGTILEALPALANARVLIEASDAAEQQPLTSPARIDVTWLVRQRPEDASGAALERGLRDVDLQDGCRVWIGCEASVMRGIRRNLIERGLDRSRMYTHGYWKLGETNHPDHDIGQEI